MRHSGWLGAVVALGLGCGGGEGLYEILPDTSIVPFCGDGTKDPGEACDEGPDNGVYGHCAADCSGITLCGDDLVDANEACDEGTANGTYGHCATDCKGVLVCGDGVTTPGAEACDDGELNGRYAQCKADCSGPGPRCGDGNTDHGAEVCDEGPWNGVPGHCREDCTGLMGGCGDGHQDSGEACDDGTDNGTYDHCKADCSGRGSHCGDGVRDGEYEKCDDGTDNGTYGHCAMDCQGTARCGDGFVAEGHEECDDGDDNGRYGFCGTNCTPQPFPFPGGIVPAGMVPDASWLDNPPPCDRDNLLVKYLNYRKRFRGDGTAQYPGFVVLGLDSGNSIPATKRHPEVTCKGQWWTDGCESANHDYPDAKGHYGWGDSTIWLGTYLSLLATEYQAFKLIGLPTDQTVQDLYYAIMAFNRVDEAAEPFYGAAPKRDGFFLRDDVPVGFEKKADGSYRWLRDDGYAGYECVTAVVACGNPCTDCGDVISQDQAIGIIYGMGMINKLIPDDIVVDGLDLRYGAREIIHRIVTKLRDDNWMVMDPTGDHPPDAWGGYAIGFSYPMTQVANKVCAPDFGEQDYADLASATEGLAAWELLEGPGWGVTLDYNHNMAYKLASVAGFWDGPEFTRRTMEDSKESFGFAQAILADREVGPAISMWHIESVMRDAPCGGPCFRTADCESVPGWMGEKRFHSPASRIGGKHSTGAEEENGIDYMEMFNLYVIYRQGQIEPQFPAPIDTASCVGTKRLADLMEGAAYGDTIDPLDPCVLDDLKTRMCGWTLAEWIDNAYRGNGSIYLGGRRWSCLWPEPCKAAEVSNRGEHGDDLMIGTLGADQLLGYGGNDCIVARGGNDTVQGGEGADEIWGGDGDDLLDGDGIIAGLLPGPDTIWGEAGNDTIDGGGGENLLLGGEGNDDMEGGGDHDLMQGGPGNDTMVGGGDEDYLQGDDGDDVAYGDAGDDAIWGGPGRDKLAGGSGGDRMWGEGGADFLKGDGGGDFLAAGFMGDGIDRLCGGSGDDSIWGTWDGDECLGGDPLIGTADDQVNGCKPESLDEDDCTDAAFEAW